MITSTRSLTFVSLALLAVLAPGRATKAFAQDTNCHSQSMLIRDCNDACSFPMARAIPARSPRCDGQGSAADAAWCERLVSEGNCVAACAAKIPECVNKDRTEFERTEAALVARLNAELAAANRELAIAIENETPKARATVVIEGKCEWWHDLDACKRGCDGGAGNLCVETAKWFAFQGDEKFRRLAPTDGAEQLRIYREKVATTQPWHEKGCALGDAYACVELAGALFSDPNVYKEPQAMTAAVARAIALAQPGCEANNASMCFALGAAIKSNGLVIPDGRAVTEALLKGCRLGSYRACSLQQGNRDPNAYSYDEVARLLVQNLATSCSVGDVEACLLQATTRGVTQHMDFAVLRRLCSEQKYLPACARLETAPRECEYWRSQTSFYCE